MDPIQDTLMKGLTDLQTTSEWPRLVHYMTLAVGLVVTSQILQSIRTVIGLLNVLDLLPLLVFLLAYMAIHIVDPVQWARVHCIIQLLVAPFIIYKIQVQLQTYSAGTPTYDLWLLLGLTGAAFQLLFMAQDYPGLRWAFLGTLIALQALEALQIGKSDLKVSDKVVLLLLLAFWQVYSVGPNETREVLWTITDMSLPLMIYTVSYLVD